jgi:transcription-repair coupling factor (superfamily II helicase)
MRAVLSNKVVFFLAPTTVLSDQHYITCKNRLEPLGVTVELLSRFRTKKEQAIILDRLHNNKIDVLVGTHRLLNRDVPTKNLGLLVVDEEHRFGVKHKEYIRGIKNRVDVLTLTATPIPRTLQQSLVGIRDTTNIETPPLSRLPIQTNVLRFNWTFIKKAIQKELKRNGQVYFLHNDVAGLPFLFEKIGSLFPGARIAVGHGQLPSKQLEGVILSFFAGDVDILLCTTIIESGLDIPNANTIIINNAHMFGLAQLYQIRGRVGRGEKQAYCFLCLPTDLQLLPDAFQRLKAIEHYSSLGSGYSVAIKDMEIRGAGNLFGYEQSGQISNVGFELYNKILNQALRESLGEKTSKQKDKLSVVFSGDALIKNEYMPLVQDRLYFYQKISESFSVDDIFSVREELVDRFGPLPIETETLLTISSLQCALYSYPILKSFIKPNVFSVVLGEVPAGLGPSAFFQRLSEAFQDSGRPYKIKNGSEGFLVIAFETVSIKDSLGFSIKFAELFSPVVDK